MPIKNYRPKKALISFLATAGYVGYLPWFPGTWASLVTGLVLYVGRAHYALPLFVLWFTVITVVGIWAATWYDRLNKTHDASAIVIDEVAGQMVALLPLVLLRETGLGWYTVAVILFRIFDIKKPFGIHRLQALPEGFGVVVDDLLAGVYAALILAGGLWIQTLL